MQWNDETRFEDFVGLISGLYKEIQRIKTSEGARLGLKGSDVMCLYYLERSKDGLTGADLARMAGVTRAAVSRTLAHLEEGGYVEVDDSGDAAVKYRAPVRLTALGGESMSEDSRRNRQIPNLSLISMTAAFSFQIQRILEFFVYTPYNNFENRTGAS